MLLLHISITLRLYGGGPNYSKKIKAIKRSQTYYFTNLVIQFYNLANMKISPSLLLPSYNIAYCYT